MPLDEDYLWKRLYYSQAREKYGHLPNHQWVDIAQSNYQKHKSRYNFPQYFGGLGASAIREHFPSPSAAASVLKSLPIADTYAPAPLRHIAQSFQNKAADWIASKYKTIYEYDPRPESLFTSSDSGNFIDNTGSGFNNRCARKTRNGFKIYKCNPSIHRYIRRRRRRRSYF